jgi:hypothetical protein
MNESLLTFEELVESGDSGDTKITAFLGNNLGRRTLLVKLPIFDLFRMSDVANERGENGEPVAQRKLDPAHAKGLAIYTLKGLVQAVLSERMKNHEDGVTAAHRRIQERLGTQPYMSLQPIVANLRTAGPGGSSLRGEALKTGSGDAVGCRFWLSQRDILWIVDGQHRRKALDIVFEFLDDVRLHQMYPTLKQSLYSYLGDDRHVPQDELNVWLQCYEVARGLCTVSVEVHLGLSIEEERQLFHDLNNLAKRVDKNLALEFDMANPINAFIKSQLHDCGVVRISGKDSDWESDDGTMSRKDIVSVNAHLFLNKSNINGASQSVVGPKLAIAKRFWEAVSQIPGFGDESSRTKTIAAQPVVLKALAKLMYDFAFGRHSNEAALEKLLDSITEIDFSHSNPVWRFYQLSEVEKSRLPLSGLVDYLPSEDEGKNRDVGNFDSSKGWMRFGAKHNDIFPIIGDMIRWQLNLPSRHSKDTAVAQ